MNDFSGFEGRDTKITGILDDLPVGIISFNAEGIIDFVNSAFEKMGLIFNLKTASLTGRNIFTEEIIPGVSLFKEFDEAKRGYPFEREIKSIKTTGGSEISLIIKCVPLFANEMFTGGIIILEDLNIISESREEDSLKLEAFKKVTAHLADLFFITDGEGRISYASGKYLKYFDSERKNITSLLPFLPETFNDTLNEVLSIKDEERFITTSDIKDEKIIFECIISPLSPKKRKFLTCTFLNVSDKIKSANLEYRLNQFKTIADVLSDGIIGVNREGKIVLWTRSVLALTGFDEDEAMDTPVWNYIPEFEGVNFQKLREDILQVSFFRKQIIVISKDGSKKEINASFLAGDDDNIFISLNSLQEYANQEKLNHLTVNTNTIILRLNNQGHIEYLNPAFTSNLNYKENEVSGKNLNDFLTDESIIHFTGINNSLNKDLVLKTRRGEKKYFFASLSPFFKDEVPDGFNVYLIEKSKKEDIFKLFSAAFQNSNEGMAIESGGKIIAANKSFGKIFGYDSENAVKGKDILELAAAKDVLKVAEYLQHYHSKKELVKGFEFSGKKKDGSSFFCELTPSEFSFEDNLYFIFSVRDISEKKRAQQIICESEEKYRNLIENIDDFLYTLERSRLFFKPVFFTNPVEKITGYTQAEMLKDIKLLLKIIHPDDLNSMKENLKKFSRSRSKMSAEFEFRIISRYGNVVWIRNKLSVVRNDKGEVEKVYGLVSDISLRRKTEEDLQKTTQNLVKLNETKDRFISIISHDLRTPFSSVLGFTDLLLNDETLTPEERNQYVRYIQESSTSMLSLVNSLLDWTRLQTGRIHFEPEKTDISEVIHKSINALGGSALQKNITIGSSVKNLYLYIDKDLIGQVFNNLISNAIKFTKEGGSINISAAQSSLTRFYEFTVSDTGIGIKPGDERKLFGVDTKFSTEGTAGEKGTGLGLSLVKEIIEKHGGNIRVESEPGRGTKFIFNLPIAAANILLVDSNTTERILYSKILKHITSDYNIDLASHGREALNKLAASTYALIVTEHTMPVMGGYDFVLDLKKLDMKVKPPVIVLSNSVDRQTIEDYNEIGVTYVFRKPVNLSIFKQAVEKTLHEGLK